MGENFHPVTHVIFDMDGLLLDTEPRYTDAIARFLAKHGKDYSLEVKRAVQGRTARNGAETMIKMLDLPLTVDQFVEQIEEMYEEVFKEYIPFMPGADRLVRHLKESGVPICIATSSKESTFKLKGIHHGKFFEQFHHVVKGSDDPEVKNGKPDPAIFLVAAKRFGENAPTDMKNVLVFEDSVNGVIAANSAGMQVVWVPAPIADRNATTATQTLDSLEQFRPELFGLPKYDEDLKYFQVSMGK